MLTIARLLLKDNFETKEKYKVKKQNQNYLMVLLPKDTHCRVRIMKIPLLCAYHVSDTVLRALMLYVT